VEFAALIAARLHRTALDACVGPRLSDAFTSAASLTKIRRGWQFRIHASEFGGCLPRIERHDDRSSAMSPKWKTAQRMELAARRAQTVPGMDAGTSENMRTKLDLVQQFPARHTYKAIPANFAKHDAAISVLQLGKNRLKEIGHEESANCRERGRRRAVTPRELKQFIAQWRQISSQENTPVRSGNSG